MTSENQDIVLVALNVSPGLEESVVDWLLDREGGPGFMSTRVHGHSSSHADYSTLEQVSGRRRRVQFEIHMPAGELRAFLDSAASEFGNADVHCTVVPVIAAGQLRSVTAAMRDD